MIYTHAAAALLALVLGFTGGWKVQAWRWGAADAARLAAEAEAARAQRAAQDKASEGHEQDRAQQRVQFQTIYRDIEHVVEKPVYRNVCLDADGLRLVERAIGGPERAASEPAATVPGAGRPE